ncbi:MAG: glycoside hydrolase family 9 protein [Eubacterium sp.]|nr:glycoside hydrolase family 9 protein [Eubacterium sp.]MCM1213665.1 glycoside hydrolase family 9 protein [Lachnospiraceae bacterium]MCM1302798.1 glycoside hydrolase family 9 protein [Butyrivibrio sp.]MCM1342519.1 glycoside hydrolase family 9 protein [Muribaculaceae bacterium]MCM1237786.1 glycoside hydrolase family 9 protein [Lachnospiraceae bacterium]
MKQYKKRIMAVWAGMFAALLGGCSIQAEQDNGGSLHLAVEGMESTPIVDYSVPSIMPNVLVDSRGYAAGCEKRAAVKGRELPETFRLMDAETGEEVYSGLLDKVTYHKELGIYTGAACFDEYDRPGVYYLECDMIGQSYRFGIQASMYEDLFRETYDILTEACSDHSLSTSEAMALLVAYEWYSEVFPDENRDQVPDVLKELQSWISYMEDSGPDAGDGVLYAAFLAKFSYNYQKFDQSYATDCLRRASTVFGQEHTVPGRDADAFFALTELYRATGLYTYRNQIVDYKSFFENNGSYLEEASYLCGAMTYMATRQKVDVELCALFMNSLTTRGEEISNRYEDMIHPVTARNNGANDLLKSAVELSCANYVLNSYQYTQITEEFLHYLMGQNAESVCFYPEEGDRSSYMLLFAQLAEWHMEE